MGHRKLENVGEFVEEGGDTTIEVESLEEIGEEWEGDGGIFRV